MVFNLISYIRLNRFIVLVIHSYIMNIYHDRRGRISSSEDEEFMRLSDGKIYTDQETYKSEDEEKQVYFPQGQVMRRGGGRQRGPEGRGLRRARPNRGRKQHHGRAEPREEWNIQANEFVRYIQVPSTYSINPDASEFNPHG